MCVCVIVPSVRFHNKLKVGQSPTCSPPGMRNQRKRNSAFIAYIQIGYATAPGEWPLK